MEINHLLKDVINLNEYITATQDVLNKYKNLKVTINIATVLTLKKIRSLEIEYFNKFDENGVACIVFERLLVTKPSKVWGVLAKELVYLLQYWLEAIRKHLVNHSTHWWMFLKLILKFIKELRIKDSAIPNMLVELTAECLFDLATASLPDVFQRHEILHCLNMVCAESGREIRFAMRTKFGDYFVKIAVLMASSGYLPCQYSSLECLLRWLVPRQERSLRLAAADKWFPQDLYPLAARTLFLNSNWMNFFQDARDFLNALNGGNGLIKSVICRRLTIGEIVIINGTERQPSWLDFNTSGRSISVLLDPRVLEVFGVVDHRACETLLIDEEITDMAILRRESLGLTISLSTLRAPYIRPTDISTGDNCQVTIVLSSRADLRSLDAAMRNTFGGKYQLKLWFLQLLLDLETDVTQSPQRSNKNRNELNSEEDTRFSHPAEVKRRKNSGYIVRNKNTGGAISPSTASTSSLTQLKDRLAALPRYKFDKEPVSVCAQPALSNVTELTEHDDRSIYTATTVKFQPYGVCHKSLKTISERKIQSDQKTSADKKARSEGETAKPKSRGGRRLLSPVVSDDNATSLLLVATVGSNDSVINETIERLSKSRDFEGDNIINLLVQEALQANPKSREVSDSGINTDEKKSQGESEAIDYTLNEIKELRNRLPLKQNCTIVSKSTSDDESNTEVINETPAFVSTTKNTRSYKPTKTTEEAEKHTFHVKAVEQFFSQHIAENVRGEFVISPTLAKKINETSSETSENYDDNYLLVNEDVNADVEQTIFNDIDIIACLNDMVDKVCSDLDKCAHYLFKENVIAGANECVQDKETEVFKDKSYRTPKSKPLEIQRPKRNIKLKNKPIKKTKTRVTKKNKNIEQEISKKMSTIIEQKEEETFLEEINMENSKENVDVVKIPSPEKIPETPYATDTGTPLVRRKRKLYSPKDDDVEIAQQCIIEKTSDDVPLSEIKTRKSTKTTSTCYRELEQERKKYIRLPRSKKSRGKVIETPSPRTLKMNSMFDNLKQTVESGEMITLVDKNTDVYNFTSDSDDDDFKKKMEIKKHIKISSFESSTVKKKRNTRRAKESESSYEEASKAKTVKRKKVTKRANKRNHEAKVHVVDLVDKFDLGDELMRKAVREELNTSLVIEQHTNLELLEIEPTLKEVPQMEEICDNVSNDTIMSKKNTEKTQMEPVHDSASNDTLAPKKRTYKRNKKTKVEHDDKSNDKTALQKKVISQVNKKNELLLIKKEKGLTKKNKATTVSYIEDDGTISPLPGLLVESTPKYIEDVNDLLTTKMLQKFKKIYQDGPDIINDSVNTQNMLSDVERFNHNAQNCISIDEMDILDFNKENVDTERDKYQKRRNSIKPKITRDSRQNIKVGEIVETVDISDVADNQSAKSIASDGINAHGDFDEAPPNPETIKEVLQPRELQDLDQSMRDYFTKLTREILHSTSKDRRSSKSVESAEASNILRNETELRVVSPVVSIKRLSFENISKWMPSRRTSDTDSPQTSPNVRSQTKNITENSPNTRTQLNVNSTETTPKAVVQKTSTPESIKFKSPVVSIERISLDEFEKWLPMPKGFEAEGNDDAPKRIKSGNLKLVYRTRSKVQKSPEPSNITDTRKLRKKSNLREVGHKLIIDSDLDESNVSRSITAFKIPKTLKVTPKKRESTKISHTDHDEPTSETSINIDKKQRTKTVEPGSDESPIKKSVGKAKPTISPIKVQDFATNVEYNSSDDECLMMKIRSMFSKPKNDKKYSLRNASKSKSVESTMESPECPLKRKSSSPILSGSTKRCVEPKSMINDQTSKSYDPKKKIDILEDVVVTESGPSVSSVNDWFNRTDLMDHRDNNAALYKDTLQNIMEKLNTTLVETNQNTSKMFVNLFIEAQKNLCDQKNEQRNHCEQVVTEMISAISGIVNEQFADLEKKSQATCNDFMEKLKKQAFDLIRDDCKQKRDMFLLLKEDVQTVINHIDSRTTHSK